MKQLLLLLIIGYLGLHNGQLALFESGKSVPDAVLPYRAELFPETDQKALQNGIPFSSESELNRLMEDFLS